MEEIGKPRKNSTRSKPNYVQFINRRSFSNSLVCYVLNNTFQAEKTQCNDSGFTNYSKLNKIAHFFYWVIVRNSIHGFVKYINKSSIHTESKGKWELLKQLNPGSKLLVVLLYRC